jgi:hypothetical protein
MRSSFCHELIILFDSPHTVVSVNSSYIVANIEADEAELRDNLIEQGLIKMLLNLMKPNTSVNSFLNYIL